MGTQVRVFLTGRDESALFSALGSTFSEVIFVRPIYYKDEEKIVGSFSELGLYPTDIQVGLTTRNFLQGIQIKKYPRGHYGIDFAESPVVEFKRCVCEEDNIHPGRFWYDVTSLQGRKSDEFKKWSASIFRFLKKTLLPSDLPFACYVGEEVAAQRETGKIMLDIY